MFDIRWIRENAQAFDEGLKRRGLPPQAQMLIELDAVRRKALTTVQEIQTQRNKLTKQIGALKSKGEDATDLIAQVNREKSDQDSAGLRASEAEATLNSMLETIPNLPAEGVPVGEDESANMEIRKFGAPPEFDFEPKEHFVLGEALGLMDFEQAARMSGSRFVVLKGALAHLQRALGQFMLDLQTAEAGYTEVAPPYLVRDAALYGTGQLPKFAEDLFQTPHDNSPVIDRVEDAFRKILESDPNKTARALLLMIESRIGPIQEAIEDRLRSEIASAPDSDNTDPFHLIRQAFEQLVPSEIESSRHWLIPTAEVPLTNLVRETILAEEDLPLRFTALTPCFRAEAGAAGKDTHGMIRQHQFEKVELVSITHPDESEAEHERMTKAAEEVLKRLELPYRVVTLSTGDMGFSARKTYDIEVWLPGQKRYREISSCSNCGEFQARRMQARFRPTGEEKGTRYVHTLNGSGLAVGRTMIAVMENCQTGQGNIRIPEALRPFMGGVEEIGGGGGGGA